MIIDYTITKQNKYTKKCPKCGRLGEREVYGQSWRFVHKGVLISENPPKVKSTDECLI